jgi:hypothetical protein
MTTSSHVLLPNRRTLDLERDGGYVIVAFDPQNRA